MKPTGIIKHCQYCNKEFHAYQYLIKQGYAKYCSRACRNKGRLMEHPEIREINKRCFEASRHLFKGENAPGWKGGISTENELLRKSTKLKEWKKLIFERDNYTCQDCNVRGSELNAHHIVAFSVNKDLRFDINNGITLCKECHIKIHKKDRQAWGVAGRMKQLETTLK